MKLSYPLETFFLNIGKWTRVGIFFFHPFLFLGGEIGPLRKKNTLFFGVHFVPNSGKILGFPKETRANIPHFLQQEFAEAL